MDDEHRLRDVVSRFLSDTFDVKQAATGAEAINILRREPVDVVILDYRLPDCSGLELLAEIRSTWPRVAVVMMTGYGSEGLATSALRLGVRGYLPKPVHGDELLDTVRRAVPEPSLPGERGNEGLVEGGLPEAEQPSGGELELALQKAIRLIQLRYWNNLSLAELARELGMSKVHLSRGFKQATGLTFRDYLLRTRLERAKVLLSRSQDSITEVADAVGFGNLPRFDRLFKRYTGLTPSAYRTQHGRGHE